MRNQTIGQAMGALKSARRLMGDDVVDLLLDLLREKERQLEAGRDGDRRKEVTILFGDLVRAERLADLFDVEDMRAVLNSYYERWISIVARFNGAIERYVGDAVMAVFGIHGSPANHARDAVFAAMGIRGALAGFNQALQQTRGISLRIRMGINTGPVLVEGCPGKEVEFRVVGDTVNVAARLESLAPNDGILIGESTHDVVKESFRFEPLPPVTLKGKTTPITVYRLTDAPEVRGVEAGKEASVASPIPRKRPAPRRDNLHPSPLSNREQLERAIAAIEMHRTLLGSDVADTASGVARERLVEIDAYPATTAKRLVTVLFGDLVGYTALAERNDPEEVKAIMDLYFSEWQKAVHRYGGVIEKKIGDAVVAIFGKHESREDDSASAIRSALCMRDALRSTPALSSLQIRVGIHRSLALLEIHKETVQGMAFAGDALNGAVELQRTAPPDAIVISRPMFDATRGLFSLQRHLARRTNREPDACETFQVIREIPLDFHVKTRGVAGVPTTMVGRGRELATLLERFAQALSGACLQFVTICGESGIGKSRLLTEFVEHLPMQPEPMVRLLGRAWPHTAAIPYSLLRTVLAGYFRISDRDNLELAQTKLTAGLQRVLGTEPGSEAAAFIGRLLGYGFLESRFVEHLTGDTRQIRGRAEVLLGRFMEQLCRQSPTLLLLEDLHWADRESLEIISGLVQVPRSMRLFAVATTRPELWERPAGWMKGSRQEDLPHHARIDLLPLPEPALRELIAELLKKTGRRAMWLEELLRERGGGNPYFVEELILWLIEEGVITVGPDYWGVGDEPPALSVPGTVEGVLQTRLDRLPSSERTALEGAAVFGKTFWDAGVGYVTEGQLDPTSWVRLQLRGLIIPNHHSRLPPYTEYSFNHVMLRDVAYHLSLKSERQRAHSRAAKWLVSTVGDRSSEWAAVVANHYEEGNERKDACIWYAKAADEARNSHAPVAAIEYYYKALDLLSGAGIADVKEGDLLEGLGWMLLSEGKYRDALNAFQRMRILAEADDDRALAAKAWLAISQAQANQGENQGSLASALRAETLCDKERESFDHARALVRQGWAFYRLGDVEEALARGLQALETAKGLDAKHEIARALNLLGMANERLGRAQEAQECKEEALALCRETGDRRGVAMLLNNLGTGAQTVGHDEHAARFYEEALAAAREIAYRDGERLFSSNLASALVTLGHFERAETLLRNLLAQPGIESWFGLASVYQVLAMAVYKQGRGAEALPLAEKALSYGKKQGGAINVCRAWQTLATILAEHDQRISLPEGTFDARACFRESAQAYAALQAQAERARALVEWADFEFHQGEHSVAADLLEEARGIVISLDLTDEVERIDRLLCHRFPS